MTGFPSGQFDLFPILFGLVFFLILGGILFTVIRAIATSVSNSAAPVVTTEATIVTKRTRTSGGGGDTMVSTWQYVTFEMPDGDRREFSVRGQDYGLLAEGDRGTLNFQGTRFNSFERHRNK